MENNFIQVPPDSTGKKLRNQPRYDALISNLIQDYDVALTPVGTPVYGATSGTIGYFTGFSSNLGMHNIYMVSLNGEFQQGETLRIDHNEGTYDLGTFETGKLLHSQVVNVADPNTPSNLQKISEIGSSFVRFSEGEQLFDVFGYTQHRTLNTIDAHDWIYVDNITRYFDTYSEVGNPQLTHLPSESSIKLSVDDVQGSMVYRTTKNYYHYIPGEGTYVLMSMNMGDNGKAGVVRRWGIFDDDDGLYFQLDGDEFSVNIRSSISGGVPNRKINRTEFNGDPLNDPNSSNFIIDFTKFNLFWIDYQWLGVGRVRFGVISPSGERITIHTVENANQNIRAYMKSGTLPLRFGISNTTTTTSPSEMKVGCIQVARETGEEQYIGGTNTFRTETPTAVGDDFVPLASVKPKTDVGGVQNKTVTMLHTLSCISTDHPIIVDLRMDPTLTGATFDNNPNPFHAVDIDTSATSGSGGHLIGTYFFPKGTDFMNFRDTMKNSMLLNQSGDHPIYTFMAKSAVPGSPTNVYLTADWKEYH